MKDYKNYYNGTFSDYDETDPNYIIANQKYPTSVDDENISEETTYSSKKIEELVSISGFKTVFVDELPDVGERNTIYFVPCEITGGTDFYDEYMWDENKSEWELIGNTRIDISLYYTKQDTNELLSEKQDNISDIDEIRSGATLGATALQEVPSDYAKKTQVIDKTSDAGTTFNIEPNVMYMFGQKTNLTINLVPGESGIVNEYLFQFTSGEVATTLNVPNTVKWMKEPDIQTSSIYQVSIENNLGIIGEFGNE